MPKLPDLHSYSDQASFDRLLILIATLVRHPGVGSRGAKTTPDQDALESVQQHMQAIAKELDVPLPDYSLSTLRKDLVTLRNYGILERNRHDWGYYLGTGAMNREELQFVLNSLSSQAEYQGDAQARRIYQTLRQRFKPMNLESKGELFYPIRAHFNRAIVYTDPEEMMVKLENRDTLFHCLDTLETAIVQGAAVELYRVRDPYRGKKGYLEAYPLQLIYQNHAWYLLYEEVGTEHLAIARIDRFKNHARVLDAPGRGIEAQRDSLKVAHKLLENGWGLFLGEPEDQQLERQGKLPFVHIKVRFFPPAIGVILEGEQRHSNQKIKPGPVHPETGDLVCVDYLVKLPKRSLNEFSRWVYQFVDSAQILSPPELIDKHRQSAQALVERYQKQ